MLRVLTISILTLLCMASVPVHAADDSWPLAVRLMSYGKYQDAAWSHLPSIGIRYIFMPVPAPDQVEAVQAKLAAAGLKPLVLRGDTDFARETCVDELSGQLETCKKMGVKYMFISCKHGDVPKTAVYERLKKLGDVAAKNGITVTLETHPDLGTNGDVQLETMKAVNHPNIRVNFDSANITYYNKGTDAVAELKKSMEYVRTVEFKDHDGNFETWNFPPLGKGKVNFAGIIEILKKNNYQGPVTIEFEGVKGVELTEEQTKESIAECVRHIRGLGKFE